MARARGFAGILLGTEQAPRADEDIDKKKSDGSYELTDAERKEKTQAGKWQAYLNLLLSCEEVPYDLVSLAKNITENAQKSSLVDCQEDDSYTALTIVCTINVTIDCDCFDVSNPSTRKNIHKRKSSQ